MADDSYLAISQIATSSTMIERMRAAVTQQAHLGSTTLITERGALSWVTNNAYLWAASPGWGAAWDYAMLNHEGEADYDPGKDPAVITDGQILATVQALGNPPPPQEG